MYEIAHVSDASSKESPIDSNTVKQLVETQLKNGDLKELPTKLVSEFSKKSSKHKFIVQVTDIVVDETPNINMNIDSNFGAAWEPEKDGYMTVKLSSVEKAQEEDKAELTQAPVAKESEPKRKDTIGGILDDYIEVEKTQQEQILVSIFWVYVG